MNGLRQEARATNTYVLLDASGSLELRSPRDDFPELLCRGNGEIRIAHGCPGDEDHVGLTFLEDRLGLHCISDQPNGTGGNRRVAADSLGEVNLIPSVPSHFICHALATPSTAEYWHIGEIQRRFLNSTPRIVIGLNNSDIAATLPNPPPAVRLPYSRCHGQDARADFERE